MSQNPYDVSNNGSPTSPWIPAALVGLLVLGIMITFVLVLAHQRKVDTDRHAAEDRAHTAEIMRAQTDTKKALCAFMITRSKYPGVASELPIQRERNDALASEAAKLVKSFGCK